MSIDEKDKLILQVLERNAKLSSRVVAAKVGLPISTVYRRIRKLEQDGVIKGYKAIIDYGKTKMPIGLYIFVNEEEITLNNGHIQKAKLLAS